MKAETVIREKCGTRNGYQQHSYYKEKPCAPCTLANAERFRRVYAAHPERERERNKKNLQRPEYRQQRLQTARKRRATERFVDSEPYSEADILHLYGTGCHICGLGIDLKAPRKAGIEGWEQGLHLDHVISLSRGGTDTIENVKPSHAICNIRKSDSK